ncbi:MAG TPA: MFS transporter, partial [Actinomycetota bacterium]|nr:MFS transporter [Actinomycetota bacterium]
MNQPSLRQNVRALPRAAWVLFAGTFVNRFGTFIIPFLTLYITARGYSAPQAGLGVAAYGLGAVGAQGFGGVLADRLGRRNTIALSMFTGAVLAFLLPEVRGLPVILLVVMLLGMFGEIYRPASAALIADLVPMERRVTAFTFMRLAVNAGFAFGLAAGGALADRSFTLLFWADAATSAVFGAIALTALPEGVRTSRHEERRHASSAIRAITADRGFLLFLAGVFAIAVIYMQNATTFALQVRRLGFSNTTYGLLLSLNGGLILFLELLVTSWTQRRDRIRMVALGAALIGLGFGTLVVAHSILALVGMTLIFTMGEMIESPNASAFVADRSPRHTRGRYQAAFGTMFAVAAIVGPIAGTSAFHADPNAVWMGCAVLGLIAAVLALSVNRRPAPDLE